MVFIVRENVQRVCRSYSIAVSVALVLLLTCSVAQQKADDTQMFETRLGKAVNLGNALEAPKEGDWGLVLQESYFKIIAEAGFDTVRVPIMFSAHTLESFPYSIDETFLERIDWVVEQTQENNLQAILVLHNYNEISVDPIGQLERFLAIWRQVASRYQNADEHVYFELLNEPKDVFSNDPALWNQVLVQGINTIRESNPKRPIIVGPAGWNSVWYLKDFKLPDDENLIATFHFYDPFAFTHQGAEWVENIPPVGTTWTGDLVELAAPWQNWSWDTDFELEGDGLSVTYNAGWAGLYLHSDELITHYDTLRYKADKPTNLLLVCGQDGLPDGDFSVQSGAQVLQNIPLTDCGLKQGLTELAIMNNSDEAQEKFSFLELSLCRENSVGEGDCTSLISNEASAISSALDVARAWATDHNIELFMGEFGVYDPADMASRIRWTEYVRKEAEARGFSWGYWEFGAGFGIYDPATELWREDLLAALIEK